MSANDVIIISPIGDTGIEQIAPARKEITRIFGYPTEIVPLIDDLSFAYHAERRQFHSTLILEKLSFLSPSRAVKVLGITRVDLFIPILTHVFGEAQLGGKSCVVSTYRLKEAAAPFAGGFELTDRILKEAIHELGHTFKLRHCREKTCIMHYCRSVTDVDHKSKQLCRYCSVLIEDEKKRLKTRNKTEGNVR
jgi:archaemetzincin